MAGNPPCLAVRQLFTWLEDLQQNHTQYGLDGQSWAATVRTTQLYRAWASGEKPEHSQWEAVLKALPQNFRLEKDNLNQPSPNLLACAVVYWAATAGVAGERGSKEALTQASSAYRQLTQFNLKSQAGPAKRRPRWLFGRNS